MRFLILLIWVTSVAAQSSIQNVRHIGSSLVLTLGPGSGLVYLLESTEDLRGDWIVDQLAQGADSSIDVTNRIVSGTRFFRVLLLDKTITLKPGVPVDTKLSLTNSAEINWGIAGELPEGVVFSDGVFFGTPSTEAAEKSATGTYTNHVTLSGNGTTSSAQFVHHVRLSFAQNIYAQRPNGPSLGTVCLKCHGSGFAPDFTPRAATLIHAKAGSGGECPNTWEYIVPGSLSQSLIYNKLIQPPCGDRMPQGGPYFSQTQIDRVARWISELQPGDTD